MHLTVMLNILAVFEVSVQVVINLWFLFVFYFNALSFQVDSRLFDEMVASVPNYRNNPIITKAWDAVQRYVRITLLFIRHSSLLLPLYRKTMVNKRFRRGTTSLTEE